MRDARWELREEGGVLGGREVMKLLMKDAAEKVGDWNAEGGKDMDETGRGGQCSGN